MLLSRYTPAPLDAIATGDAATDSFAVTFDDGYAETMRRTFLRSLHVTPSEYRHRFQFQEESA